MKTLFRVLVLLVIATLIGGLMYVGVNAAGTSNVQSFEGGSPQFQEGGEQFRPEREEHGERGEGGFRFPGGMIKAGVLMTFAGGIYYATTWTGKKVKKLTTS